jgi:hypothetical protein
MITHIRIHCGGLKRGRNNNMVDNDLGWNMPISNQGHGEEKPQEISEEKRIGSERKQNVRSGGGDM